MTLKDLTDAAGIERVIWIDDLFDAPPENGVEIHLRELAAHAKARNVTLNLADYELTPDESVEEWLAKIEEAREEGMTVAVILEQLRQRLTDGENALIPDYNESAIRRGHRFVRPGSVACFDTTIETLLEFGYTP